MDVITALDLLSRRSASNRREALPVRRASRSGTGPRDPWPYAATAAVMLAGYLDDAQTDVDLNEGLDHFQSLYFGGVVTGEEWADAMLEVVSEARRHETVRHDAHRREVRRPLDGDACGCGLRLMRFCEFDTMERA